MRNDMGKEILKNKNYKEYRFNGGGWMPLLLDKPIITKIFTAPVGLIVSASGALKDLHGNKVKIEKSINRTLGGYRYVVVNLDHVPPSGGPDQVALFDDQLYCRCGQEIDNGCFNSEMNLQRGNLFGKCDCGQGWRIDFKVRESICDMSTAYKLWNSGVNDIYNALECHLFFD